MALSSSKKIEVQTPFGVGAVYKTSGFKFVDADIVEFWISERKRRSTFINEIQTSFVSPSPHEVLEWCQKLMRLLIFS